MQKKRHPCPKALNCLHSAFELIKVKIKKGAQKVG